ncbi:dihydroxy-acid dehydratase [Pararobbsia silviterrae]|uniref:Dihydroxy-acid dehydratase n=1 Tax=Pararobbsia silviterrae TaxID=1792498 RepID=A0A494XM16_9BURK|nr:dihydroxy-acid dehydratase [Pararobbsia silviterrae]RKP51745.1 dihydroxy-acid dehydratase [Pararobbsia silviterrae]
MTKYRSNVTPGTAIWAGRRAHFMAMGLSEEDMLKPKIAIINTSSELAMCFNHLDDVAAEVKKAIREAGGIPFEIRTAASSDFITNAGKFGAYVLATRDLIASDIEVQVEGALLDGMVCLASCDKSAPGQLMAAGRINVPTIVVICGYQASGEYKGKHTDIEDVFLHSSHVATGKTTVEELGEMAKVAIRSPGVCAGMGTANSMHVLSEALGMTIPGSAPVRAVSPRMLDNARAAGRRIVEMIDEDLRPRDIITDASVRNAARAVIAVSGSINCVKHLQAIAIEAGLDINVMDVFAEYGRKVPLLCAVRPSGDTLTEAFDDAGGARGLLDQLRPILETDVMTVSGKTLAQILDEAPPTDTTVIQPLDNPVSTRPTLNIVKGSLIPGGGIIRIGGTGERTMRFRGKAIIYHARDEAIKGIANGEVKPGHVVVLRGLGVQGGPGLAMTSAVVFAIDGADLINKVAVITEGQLSGLVNKGLVVGEATPEAAAGGPLALLDEGDEIEIDVEQARVDLLVPEEVLAERRKQHREFGARIETGWLNVYQRNVSPVHQGAVLSPGGRPLAGQ